MKYYCYHLCRDDDYNCLATMMDLYRNKKCWNCGFEARTWDEMEEKLSKLSPEEVATRQELWDEQKRTYYDHLLPKGVDK